MSLIMDFFYFPVHSKTKVDELESGKAQDGVRDIPLSITCI